MISNPGAEGVSPVRVLFVAPTGDLSGGENSLLALLERLDRDLAEPVVLAPFEGRFTERLGASGIEVLVRHFPNFSADEIRPSRLPNPHDTWTASREIAEIIRRREIGIVHINSYRVALAPSLAARRVGVPVIWHVRDIPGRRWVSGLVSLAAASLADRVIVVSAATANALRRPLRGSERIRVVHNGIDAESFLDRGANWSTIRSDIGVPETVPLVCNVGQMTEWKGQDLLLDVAREVLDHFPDVHFVFVGSSLRMNLGDSTAEGVFEQRLGEMVDRLDLQRHVHFLGYRDDVSAILQASDLYVHTARRPDPLPRVLLEAMACATPIVAPCGGGIPEMIEDGQDGRLYRQGSTAALVRAVLESLQDRAEAQALARRARATVKSRFSLEAHVGAIQGIYRELLSSRRAVTQ